MLGIGVGVSCSGGATQVGGSATEVQWRRGSLVRDWRGGGIGELREAKAELASVLARAEEDRSYELHGEQVAAELDGEGF